METIVETGDIDPRELAQLEDTDRQKRQAAQAAIDTSIQKGAWGQFGSPAGGPSVAQQPTPVDPFQQQVQREMLDQVEARKRAGQAQIAALEERARITGDKSAQLGKEIEEAPPIPVPNVPKPPPIPTREQSIDPTAAKSLFAVASVIGALGMMGGRGRGMLAMSGMTGMIEGFREGNTEKYKAAKDQYDRAVDEQLNTYKMEYQQYLAKVQNQKDTWAQRILAINLQARAAGDKAMIAATEAGNADQVFGQLMDFEKVIASLEKAKQDQSLFGPRQKLIEAQIKEHEARTKAIGQKDTTPGGKTPAETRQELTALLHSYEKERDALQKEAGAFNWGMGTPKETRDRLDAVKQKIAGIRQQLEGGGAQPKPGGTQLTKELAAQILKEAGGNKDRARQIARERGYDF